MLVLSSLWETIPPFIPPFSNGKWGDERGAGVDAQNKINVFQQPVRGKSIEIVELPYKNHNIILGKSWT